MRSAHLTRAGREFCPFLSVLSITSDLTLCHWRTWRDSNSSTRAWKQQTTHIVHARTNAEMTNRQLPSSTSEGPARRLEWYHNTIKYVHNMAFYFHCTKQELRGEEQKQCCTKCQENSVKIMFGSLGIWAAIKVKLCDSLLHNTKQFHQSSNT